MKSSVHQNSGLTLVELLVVLAIIALLAMLLLPSLSRAKNQAAKTTDLSDLRQIMVGVHVYTLDNNDIKKAKLNLLSFRKVEKALWTP